MYNIFFLNFVWLGSLSGFESYGVAELVVFNCLLNVIKRLILELKHLSVVWCELLPASPETRRKIAISQRTKVARNNFIIKDLSDNWSHEIQTQLFLKGQKMTTVQGRTISMLKSKHHTKEVRPLRPRPVIFNTLSNSITWCSETITILKFFLR